MQEERGACDKRRTAEETLPSHPAHRQGTAPLNCNSSSPYTMLKLRKPPSTSRKPQPLSPGLRFLKPVRQVSKLLLSQAEHNNANENAALSHRAGSLQCSPGSGRSVLLLVTPAALLAGQREALLGEGSFWSMALHQDPFLGRSSGRSQAGSWGHHRTGPHRAR